MVLLFYGPFTDFAVAVECLKQLVKMHGLVELVMKAVEGSELLPSINREQCRFQAHAFGSRLRDEANIGIKRVTNILIYQCI